jgi:hypothetical protein
VKRRPKVHLESSGCEVDGVLNFIVPDNDSDANISLQCRDRQLRDQISRLRINKGRQKEE